MPASPWRCCSSHRSSSLRLTRTLRPILIEDGDLLVVEEDEDPPDGTVVVALLGGGDEVTVKRLYRERGEAGAYYVRLRPENGGHDDIVLRAEDLVVQGRVVYVVHPPRERR